MNTEGPTLTPVNWIKARDSLLAAAPNGRQMEDGETVQSEAALVLSGEDGQLIVIEGSFRRLLKTLEYARTSLLATAPLLEIVHGYPDDEQPLEPLEEHDEPVTAGLRCPHCGLLSWAGGSAGIQLVEGGERAHPFALREDDLGGLTVVGDAGESISPDWGHYECLGCARPVELPAEVEEP